MRTTGITLSGIAALLVACGAENMDESGGEGAPDPAAAVDTTTAALTTPNGCTAGANGKKANIVMIVTDDLDLKSFDILLANGKLPNIKNWLVDRGTRFTQSYVGNSLCGPSRATFLTGRYSHNNLVNNNQNAFNKFSPHAASTSART